MLFPGDVEPEVPPFGWVPVIEDPVDGDPLDVDPDVVVWVTLWPVTWPETPPVCPIWTLPIVCVPVLNWFVLWLEPWPDTLKPPVPVTVWPASVAWPLFWTIDKVTTLSADWPSSSTALILKE